MTPLVPNPMNQLARVGVGLAASAITLATTLGLYPKGEMRDGQFVRFAGSFAAATINLVAAWLLWRHARSLAAKLVA
ncbi:MAG: hypothetical protein FJ091_03765 [Deltaproteobacteria bacterium]|nr:hypothetical protein [Deltaproteobacteria bacterium]